MPDKLHDLLISRKFWGLVASLVTIAAGFYTGQVDATSTINAVVAAFGLYAVGTGIENAGK